MNHLFSIALVLFTLARQHQELPAAFYKLPDDVRAKATVIVTGNFGSNYNAEAATLAKSRMMEFFKRQLK